MEDIVRAILFFLVGFLSMSTAVGFVTLVWLKHRKGLRRNE